MIDRILIKDYLNFKNVELNFKEGLSVFTGVSGAGKSVLMSAIMAVFGLKDSEARLIEADVEHKFELDEFGIENEEVNIFKLLKDKSTRYFINQQAISKKNLAQVAREHIKYLSAKEANEFENEKFLNLLDRLEISKNEKFKEIKQEFEEVFLEFSKISKELATIKEEEKKIEELKELASFEIEKIRSVGPKKGEFEELMETKKRLSKKDKINEAWARAERIFELEHSVNEALSISDLDNGFFEDAMNELRVARDSLNMEELDDIDVESVLDRIEALNAIIRRYGSEEEALEALAKKEKELARYENLSFEKSELEKKFEILSSVNLKELEAMINLYLKELYMPDITLRIEGKKLDILGVDEICLNLNETSLKNLSSGELNRLRLAFIAASSEITKTGGDVIILDEIDANLSGKEAMSIANVLLKLANFYQIFAISHQPQLSSKANSHFLVERHGESSVVRELDKEERVNELARMISGEHISEEAINFAKGLLK